MVRLGDIVRIIATVNVAQHVRALGLAQPDLPKGKMEEAIQNEMGSVLSRIVDNLFRCYPLLEEPASAKLSVSQTGDGAVNEQP